MGKFTGEENGHWLQDDEGRDQHELLPEALEGAEGNEKTKLANEWGGGRGMATQKILLERRSKCTVSEGRRKSLFARANSRLWPNRQPTNFQLCLLRSPTSTLLRNAPSEWSINSAPAHSPGPCWPPPQSLPSLVSTGSSYWDACLIIMNEQIRHS